MESQRLEILKHLQKGRSVTPLEALEKWGCFRLSGRIIELRKAGHNIVTEVEEKNGKRYARYKMGGKDGN